MILYKYFPPVRVSDVLDKQQLRVSQTRAFNDPFELFPVITGIGNVSAIKVGYRNELLEHYTEQWSNNPAVRKRFPILNDIIRELVDNNPLITMDDQEFSDIYTTSSRQWLEEQDSNYGVISLSERRDSILMWAHYTEGFKGFCVGFDAKGSLLNWSGGSEPADLDNMINHAWQVHYSTRRPSAPWDRLNFNDFYLTKNIDWAYEQEWRVVKPFSECIMLHKQSDDKIRDLPIWMCTFDPANVKEIYIGPSADGNTRDAIYSAISNAYRHVYCQSLELNPRQYGLLFADDR